MNVLNAMDQTFDLVAILTNPRFQGKGIKLDIDFGIPQAEHLNAYETSSMDGDTFGEVQHQIFQLRCLDVRPRTNEHFRGIWTGEDKEAGKIVGFRIKFLWDDPEAPSEPDEQPSETEEL